MLNCDYRYRFVDQYITLIFSSPEPKARGELIVYQSSLHLCVCQSVCVSVNIFKLEYLRNQWANRNKFYLNHHWGGGKAALGFGPDRIGTLVSMATIASIGL